uniref:Uncharacterized protein n=1 Tax=Salmonella sp. TaxID=599 RepID=A0A482EU98_SALSP|nr:hypothetical protein NNIBIDOC_00064 [Salmonella sp.]
MGDEGIFRARVVICDWSIAVSPDRDIRQFLVLLIYSLIPPGQENDRGMIMRMLKLYIDWQKR